MADDVAIPTPVSSGATDQPNAVQPEQPQGPPPVPEGFSDAPVQAPATPEGFSDAPPEPHDVGGHGILSRAWDWVNKPIADNVLPKDIKTADIVKAAAFEKLTGSAYIPGVNDFDTLAKRHFGEGKSTVKKDAAAAAAGKGQIQEESHPFRDAVKTFVSGSAKDASQIVSGLTSPLGIGMTALGAGEAGALGKTAATVAKPLAVAAGTAFAGQGASQTYDAVKDALTNGLTPENTQAGLTGAAQVAGGVAGAAKGVQGAKAALTPNLSPTTEEVGSTSVPVRGKTLAARIAAKSVPDRMATLATQETGPAVAKGIGTTAQEAVGTEGEITPNQHDRMGLRQIQEQLKEPAQETFKKLDDKSGQMLSEAQQMAEDASDDYSAAGRKQYRQAMQLQDDIFDQYKDDPDMAGHSLDEAKAAWRKQAALGQINKKLAQATESSESGATDYQFKQGKQLSEAVDSLVKNDKDILQRAGFTDEHIDQLQKFGRIIRQQAVDQPKMQNYIAKAARTLVGGGIGAAIGGPIGFAGGAAGEAVAEHVSSLIADKLVGKALTDTSALKTLNDGFIEQKPTAEVAAQLKKDIAKSDPGWAAKTAKAVADLVHNEKGELTIPFTGESSGVAAAPAQVGTEAGAISDTQHFQNAKAELGEGTSISDVARRAQEMKNAVKTARDKGTAAAKVAMDKSFPDPFAKPRLAADIASWQPPPELGAFSDAPDPGKAARAANPEPTRGETKGSYEGKNRRTVDRAAQAAEDARFNLARKELGDDASSEEIMKRVDELKKSSKQK